MSFTRSGRANAPALRRAAAWALPWLPSLAQASLLSGEALDTAADVISWIALIIVPVVVITVFWLVHILPEKIAEQKRHPQAKAIQVMCLLSLVFGGMLWPIAWLWAYSKPVFYKMAYDTDAVTPHGDGEEPASGPLPVVVTDAEAPAGDGAEAGSAAQRG